MADATTHEWLTLDDDEEILWENSPTLITAADGFQVFHTEPLTVIAGNGPKLFASAVRAREDPPVPI